MNPLTMLWTDLRNLVLDTGRVWWRLLPQLTAIYLLGWLGFQLALKLAAMVGEINAWFSIVIFAFGFISRLTALILMLRLAGRELGIKDMIPAEERAKNAEDERISHLLAVTLLPFLGIYAAFGEMNKAANQLVTEQISRAGLFGGSGILNVIAKAAHDHPLKLAGGLVALYLVRRGVDLLHEKTGWRALGLAVAFLESLFMLVVILGGVRIWQTMMIWLGDRAFVGWLAAAKGWLSELLSVIKIDLPAVLTTLGNVFAEQIWPTLTDVITQPIIWLAVAALVYGSNVLSVAELWRKGRPLANRAPGAKRIGRLSQRVAPIVGAAPPRSATRVVLEVREAFLGDIDDKYLPTFYSIRLVLRAGVIFLGAFIFLYAVQDILSNYLRMIVVNLIGGQESIVWIVVSPYLDLLWTVPFEPLRISLLAVAFHRCLQLFMARARPEDRTPVPADVLVRAES